MSLMKLHTLPANSKKGFSLLAGINRPIIPRQVTKLAQSINKSGCKRPVLIAEIDFITGRREKYIIDGQHLYHALIRGNMDIPYDYVDVKNKRDLVETISLFNATSASWCMMDFVRAWGSIEKDYVKLNHYFNTYDFDLAITAAILSNMSFSGSVSTRLKKGEFKIVDEAKAVVKLDYLTDTLNIIPRMDRFSNRYLCSEYMNLLSTLGSAYNHAYFLEKLKKQKNKLILVTQEEGKLKDFLFKLSK